MKKKSKQQKKELEIDITTIIGGVIIIVALIAAAIFISGKFNDNNNPTSFTDELGSIATTMVTEITSTTSIDPTITTKSTTTTSKSTTTNEENTTNAKPTTTIKSTTTTIKPISTTNAITTSKPTTTTSKPTTTKPVSSGRKIVDPRTDKWNLIVVNRTREFTSEYEPKLSQIFSTGYYLDSRVTPYYEEMYNAAKKDGYTLTPYSCYRSYDRQANNLESLAKSYMSQYNLNYVDAKAKAETVILPAGTSEHNLGLAIDIINTKTAFKNSAEYKWLCENAYKYGFILRYAEDKVNVTNIVYEPWHWRFVGVEYAEDIMNSGLCLEEYLTSVGIPY